MRARPEQDFIDNLAETRGLKILWVKIGGLWPCNTGGRIRSFNIISRLSRRHRVTVLTTHLPGENSEDLVKQLPSCVRVASFESVVPKSGSLEFMLALMRSWFSTLPVDVWKSRVPALADEVNTLLESGQFDICVADFLVAIPNVPLQARVPVVFFAHNVEYMIWKRLCKTETGLLRKLLLAIEWRKMKRYEEMACEQTDLTIAVSPDDRDLLTAGVPDTVSYSIPTGVDIDYFQPADRREGPAELVFTGSMDWHPNEDAIIYFMDEILPLIRRVIPETSLTVVGRNPSLKLSKHAFKAKVSVTGTVSDIRPYVAMAAVYVVPLRIGGGTRIKIFEALAMGKAVVSTTVGAEGLPLVHDKHFMCADDPVDFAWAVVALLKNADRRKALGAAGRELVAANYSWDQVSREFDRGFAALVK